MPSHSDPVQPTPFDAAQPAQSAATSAERRTETAATAGGSVWVLPALIALVILAVLVIVWLPTRVALDTRESAAPAPLPTNRPAHNQASVSEPGGSAIAANNAPWSDAQTSHLRKTAQEVAAQLLELQLALQERGIEQWAPQQLTAVIKQASAGDTLYQSRQYEKATAQYQQGLDILQQLQDTLPQRLAELLAQIQQAIDRGDAQAAQKMLAIATLLSPDSSEIAALQQRTNTLPELLSLLDQAAAAESANNLPQAQQLLQQAAALDPQHPGAQNALQRVTIAVHKRDFNQAMSAGYSALDADRYSAARQAFQTAAKLQQGSTEAASALQEVAAAESAQRLAVLDRQGRSYERQEQWQRAVQTFEQAQKLDSNVLFAKQGLQRSRTRAQLDAQLRQLLAKPARLSDAAVAASAAQILEQATQIAGPGPLLAKQIKTLDQLLIQADSPVSVTLRSDRETAVTVYKVARLGAFAQKTLNLRPGTYTAVGTRNGYRDVRLNFTLTHDAAAMPVTIICTEPI